VRLDIEKDSFQLFAKYNLWMNEKLFAAAAAAAAASLASMTSGKTRVHSSSLYWEH
jgi:uncharacterized damage-inducible protein DinB